MKTINIIIIGLCVFAFLFLFISIENDLFVRSYDDYKNNPDCEFKQLDNGFTQLTNCAKYKLKEIKDDIKIVDIKLVNIKLVKVER